MAAALRDWLPHVIQAAVPFFSPKDIDSGDFWDSALRGQIAGSKFAVICVTEENLGATWLNYEAGALAEKLDGLTAPWLLGMTPERLKASPMSRLQARSTDRAGTEQIVESINKRLPAPLGLAVLREAFDVHWQKLEGKLLAIPAATQVAPVGTQEDLLVECVRNTRRILEYSQRERQAQLRLQLAALGGAQPGWDESPGRRRMDRSIFESVEPVGPMLHSEQDEASESE